MADVNMLSAILDDLSNSEDTLSTLLQLKTALGAINPSQLKDVVPNISFSALFDCVNSSDSEQIEVCCDILDKLLSPLHPAVILQQFQDEFYQALSHPVPRVRLLCTKQVLRALGVSFQEVISNLDLFVKMVNLLSDQNLGVAESAGAVLTRLGETEESLDVLFSGTVVEEMNAVLEMKDEFRYRMFQVISNVACSSPAALLKCSASGLLQHLLNDLYKDDILVQLTCLDQLSNLSMCDHGLQYLAENGTVEKLENMMGMLETDALVSFLLPGLVKFFGGIARLHTKEVCDRNSAFLKTVFHLVTGGDETLMTIAIETIGFIGKSVEGKLALERHSSQMKMVMKKIGIVIKDAPSHVRAKALNAIVDLLHVRLEDQTNETSSVTESWFNSLGNRPMEQIMSISTQPFADLRYSTFNIYCVMALQAWGQQTMNSYPGFNEYLLDRSTENEKVGKELKYKIVRTLVESPTAAVIYGQPYFMKLREYHREGAFYVRAQAEVVMEGAS
ncbi:26S proteasome non-ATPase regulatory subunit 5-like [Lineus longissimus]|uniref:26S proteasome non-ATPase regulatory subunit 5-like n=1 Tax=Lineus longissimus TaxID=88925 RepID=UPI002B4F5D09